MIGLRAYQSEAITAIERAVAGGVQRPLLVLPTGTGKTIVFVAYLLSRGGPALVLAHRDELIEHAVAKIRLAAPDARVGIVKGDRDEHDAEIVVASVQTLARLSRRARLGADYRTIVVDEAHHANARTYLTILKYFGAFADDGPVTLGVTATPERADGASLGDVWQEIVYRAEILPMIEAGYLCDLAAIQVRLEADLDEVHTRGGDWAAGELEEAMRRANAPIHAVEAYKKHAAGRTALVFTPGVQSAHETVAAFNDADIAAEVIDGDLALTARRGILNRLRSGETQVVANCAVLTEGFDEPRINCIVIARPTRSRPLYMQMIGRGARVWPGKTDCLVLDLVGSTSRHELVTAATLFDLSPQELRNATVSEAVARRRQAQHQQDAQGHLVAQTVDLFRRRSLNWVASDPSRYVLMLADGVIVLRTTDLITWSVEHAPRGRDRTTIAHGLDLGYAQGVGEDFARQLGAAALIDRYAPWRHAAATDRQLTAMRRWRISIPAGLTRGEASDLLAAAIGRIA